MNTDQFGEAKNENRKPIKYFLEKAVSQPGSFPYGVASGVAMGSLWCRYGVACPCFCTLDGTGFGWMFDNGKQSFG